MMQKYCRFQSISFHYSSNTRFYYARYILFTLLNTGYAIVKSVLSGDTVLLMGSVTVGSGRNR